MERRLSASIWILSRYATSFIDVHICNIRCSWQRYKCWRHEYAQSYHRDLDILGVIISHAQSCPAMQVYWTLVYSEVQTKTGFAAVHRHTRPSLSPIPIRCPKLLLCGTYTGEWNHTVIDSTIWRSIEANHVQGILCYLSKDKYDSSLQIIYHLSRYNCSDTLGQAYLICSTNDVLSYQASVSYLSSRIPRSYYATAHFDSISARHPARL